MRLDVDKMMTMRDMFEQRNVDELKKLVKLLGIPVEKRKQEIVESIMRRTEDSKLLQLWESLDELQQKAVSETLYSDSKCFCLQKFVAKYSAAPYWGSLSPYERTKKATALNFFMPMNFTIPSDLVPKLMKFVPKPRTTTVNTSPELRSFIKRYDFDVPLIVKETERAALYELAAMLRLVEQGKISISEKKRWPTGTAIRNVKTVLYGDDVFTDKDLSVTNKDDEYYAKDLLIEPIRAAAWPVLLQSGKLVRKSGTKLALSRAGKNALIASPPEETINVLFDNWYMSDAFDEFNRINSIKGQTGKGKRGMTPPSSRKIEIRDAMTDCPPGQWIAIDEFSKFMRAADYSFEITDNPWGLYICEAKYGNLGYAGYHGWNILQERYIKCIIIEYLATLGIVDIAYTHPADACHDFGDLWGADDLLYLSRYDGLLYFRITNLGAYCLDIITTYEAPVFDDSGHIQVLPNLDIIVMDKAIPPADLLLLENFAEKGSEHLWKISKKKLLLAYENGHSIDDFLRFLAANSSNELPETVLHLVGEVKDRSRSLKDRGMARLITCNSLETATLIANSSKSKAYCKYAGGNDLIVLAKDEAKFKSALRGIGYALRIDS